MLMLHHFRPHHSIINEQSMTIFSLLYLYLVIIVICIIFKRFDSYIICSCCTSCFYCLSCPDSVTAVFDVAMLHHELIVVIDMIAAIVTALFVCFSACFLVLRIALHHHAQQTLIY